MLAPFVGGWPAVNTVKKSQTLAAPVRWLVCLATGVFLLGSLALGRADEPPKVAQTRIPADPVKDLITYSSKYATIVPLIPGPSDPKIARLVANLLERAQYLQHPLDDEMARRFLRRYLDTLDPTHSLFLQTDVDEFARFQPKLAELTLKAGSTLPAREIFARFMERVEERVEFVAGLLQDNHFEFAGSDRFDTDRKHAAWPKDVDAAHELWRQYVRYEYLEEKLNKQKPDEIIKKLSARYKRLLRSWGELDSDDILQIYLTALAQGYDPHSDYMGKALLENFAINMRLSLVGIGALLRDDDGYCKIESLITAGPAERSKQLKPGDRIIAVQQKDQEPVDIIGWKLNKVVELIRGQKATPVTLTVIPADSTDTSVRRTLTLIRDEIPLEDQAAKAKIVELPGADGQPLRLGVIDLPSFYAGFDLGGGKDKPKSEPRSCSADVAKLLKKLVAEKVGGVILDLRRNGGGSLEEAIRLTGLFIKDGPVVQVRDAQGEVSEETDPDEGIAYDGPLIVLTSRFSASASEILAAALQDHGRAVVVGDRNTHGKGTVQTIYELNRFMNKEAFPKDVNPGALKVTIRKFYRVNGASTQLKGVTPDIVLSSVANFLETGEEVDDYALPWDTIESAKGFKPLDRVAPLLPELRRRAEARQAGDKDFAYIREDIARYQKLLADKTVSLNEQARLQEKEENEARLKARRAEHKARGEPKDKIYEITLKLAEEPGLPAPLARTNEPPAKLDGAVKPPGDTETADNAEDDKTPALDTMLEETQRILADLIALGNTPKPAAPVATTVAR
jgi:carboxyl-terminal processing protease